MFWTIRGQRRLRFRPLVLAIALGMFCGMGAPVQAGGHGHGHRTGHGCWPAYGPMWGEYGLGPHFNYRGCGDCDLGYPYFTHAMCPYGAPSYGPPATLTAGSPVSRGTDFGPYTGAPPFPDRIAPSIPLLP